MKYQVFARIAAMQNVFFRVSLSAALFACIMRAQESMSPLQLLQPGERTSTTTAGNVAPEGESKRIFFIIPNHRTAPTIEDFRALTPEEKFAIATDDSFDRGTFALAALFGAEGQLTNSNRSFGQGAAGFGKYFGTSLADFAIGNYMTEAVYPTLLHQDPRYFRRGTGTGRSRFVYAVSQIWWTHSDSGSIQFNYSELIGNSTAVAISNAYYRDNRTASHAVSQLSLQIGVDMASNVLKEFWPDVARKFRKKRS
jgi:hypothetical protein